ncbi:hypothetical protein [Geobacter sp. SVR]|uniref:hypothetical protein n=1 Tax=Geobacter sp. SVR TaxID=2495594 RepID=UPI00143EF8ED|nr:hypothetical protein [Geobacter sp. SVR]BCS55176.1 hypothetical protein GSVR_34840 [Geobacter sp. SVR]GCF85357.1 hypothetical protein GSbR_19570 [Geobacter sp. SVR]
MTAPQENKASWLDYIHIEQLPEDYQLLVRIIGLDLTIKVAFQLPKVHLYFKSPEKLFLPAKEKYIRDTIAKYPGTDRRRLALETGLSERHVYTVVSESQEREKQQGFEF